MLRFDPNSMKPYLSRFHASREILERCSQEAAVISFDWHPGHALLIDNWRMMHGRGAGRPGANPERRVLERVLVLGG